MKKIGLLPHLGKKKVKPVAKELADWLGRRGLDVMIPEDDAAALGLEALGVPEPELDGAELIVVLGGDGTILRAVRLLSGQEVPLLGVNFGKFGFLSEVKADGLYDAMDEVLGGRILLEKRLLLTVRLVFKDGRVEDRQALNEVVVERGPYQRVMELDVSINERFFTKYVADGLILATPTGSTAYSFSAGGPIASPEARMFLLTPICAHSLFGRTLILSDAEQVKIGYSQVYKGGGVVSVDGFRISEIAEVESLEVSVAEGRACLVRREKRSFYAILREKLRVWDVPLGPRLFD